MSRLRLRLGVDRNYVSYSAIEKARRVVPAMALERGDADYRPEDVKRNLPEYGILLNGFKQIANG